MRGDNKAIKRKKYLGKGIGAAIWRNAARSRNVVLLAEFRHPSDQFLQVLHRKVLGNSLDIFITSIHPKGIFASLQRLHSNPKEVCCDLDTRQFLATGVLKFMDTGHQCLCRCFFFFSGFSVPGSAAKNLGTSIERSYVVLRRVGAFFVHIEPSFAPSLDGVGEFDVKVLDVRANANNNTAYVVGDVVGAIAAEAENAFPQSPIGRDSEEAFAKMKIEM